MVVAGDLDADPAQGIRFFTGRQSLEGMSVSYRDAWENVHPKWAPLPEPEVGLALAREVDSTGLIVPDPARVLDGVARGTFATGACQPRVSSIMSAHMARRSGPATAGRGG